MSDIGASFGQSVMDPQLLDALLRLKNDIFKSMNCVKVGKISRFDGTKKTAEVQILFKRVLPGNKVTSYPVLLDVPVFTLQGGGASLQAPITAGDQCLVLFSDRNIDAWFKNGSEAAPFDARCHDLSDGIALVGLNALNSTLANYPTDEIRLIGADAAKAKVSVKKDSTQAALLYSTTIKILVTSALAQMVQGTGEVTVTGNKIRVKNAATDLLTAINGLIDIIVGLTVVDPISGPLPVSPTVIAQLNAQKTIFQGLLST